jgi:hypothetical protein
MKTPLLSLVAFAAVCAPPAFPNVQEKGHAAPYPLTTCPVSGEPLGSMGDPVVAVFEEREVKFCCDRCPGRFEKDVKASLAKLDEAIVASQKSLYPLETSVVSGEKLGSKAVEFVYGNRLVRVADEKEKGEFAKESAKYLAKLDEAVVERQSKGYPLTTCPVEGAKLDAAKEPVNLVFAGRLIRVCCTNCRKSVLENPTAALGAVDEARKGAGKEPKKGSE